MSNLRDRVNALLTLAQHPNTPQHEAETALALASKLMQKHGLSETDLAEARAGHEDIAVVVKHERIQGKYRVRRTQILQVIAHLHSCANYRDLDDGDECVVVLYGRESDIFAARTLFAAVDALAARVMPKGDRAWRVAWLKGFQKGIEEALTTSRKEFIAETPGSQLVLADRFARADHEMRTNGPPLSGGYTYVDTRSGAYTSGRAAGSSFNTGNRSFTRGIRGELA